MVLAAMLAIATAQNAPLNPSGKWIVDYRPDMCVAQRSFGEATAATVFGFEPAVAMDSGGAKLLILSPDTRGGGVRHGRAEIMLRPSGEKQTLDFVSWSLKSSVDHRALEISVDGTSWPSSANRLGCPSLPARTRSNWQPDRFKLCWPR